MAYCSPEANPAGTVETPGCERDGPCESSVSSECARTPFANAASIGPQTILEATTVAISFPPYARANSSAARRAHIGTELLHDRAHHVSRLIWARKRGCL